MTNLDDAEFLVYTWAIDQASLSVEERGGDPEALRGLADYHHGCQRKVFDKIEGEKPRRQKKQPRLIQADLYVGIDYVLIHTSTSPRFWRSKHKRT